jgi:HAD superfamily hydrolase (TIGR01509 family)
VADAAVLIFDFDGTIADTEMPLFVAWSELYEQHGVPLDLARWQSIIGTDDDFDPWDELVAVVGRPLDRSLNAARQRRRDALIHEAGLRPGIERWLEDAERLGVPVGIASSSPPEWVEHHLARLGLRDRFACLACADGVIPGKPDPTSYRHAVEQLAGSPALSVAVEDSPNGVRAAVDAGLYTIAVPHDLTRALDLTLADEVHDSLEHISLESALAAARARS